jgi:hypothetical protein
MQPPTFRLDLDYDDQISLFSGSGQASSPIGAFHSTRNGTISVIQGDLRGNWSRYPCS